MKKFIGILLVVIMLVTTIGIAKKIDENIASDTITDTTTLDNWSMMGHDPSHSAFSSSQTSDTNDILFNYEVAGSKKLGIGMIIDNLNLYVPKYTSGDIYRLNPYSGEYQDLIRLKLNDQINTIPAIGDGRLFCAAAQKMYGVNLETEQVWSYPTGAAIYSSPAVSNSKVYFGSDNGNVYCFSTSGQLIWTYITGAEKIRSSPSVVDGKVYVSSFNLLAGAQNYLYCLDAEGNGDGTTNLLWSGLINSASLNPIVVSNDRVVVSTRNSLYCFNTITHEVEWSKSNEVDTQIQPTVYAGHIFWGNGVDGILSCFTLDDGDFVWSTLIAVGVLKNQPVIADGKIYVQGLGFGLACLNVDDGNIIWTHPSGYGYAQLAIYDGVIYALSNAGYNLIGFREAIINSPPLKPSTPSGPTSVVIGEIVSFTTSTTDPDDGDLIWYQWRIDSSLVGDWQGPYASGETATLTVEWPRYADGASNLSVKAKDASYGAESEYSDPLVVTGIVLPPNKPIITGPSEGTENQDLSFTVTGTDPGGHFIKFGWDWNNDGVIEPGDWSEFDSSDTRTHQFGLGEHTIKVVVENLYGLRNWSDPFTVSILMPANISIENITSPRVSLFARLLIGGGITADIRNSGDQDAVNVTWNITLSGGAFIFKGKEASGMITLLEGDSAQTIANAPVYGLGKAKITVTARTETLQATAERDCFIFLGFIFLNGE